MQTKQYFTVSNKTSKVSGSILILDCSNKHVKELVWESAKQSWDDFAQDVYDLVCVANRYNNEDALWEMAATIRSYESKFNAIGL